MAEPGTGFLAGLVIGKSIVTKAGERRAFKDRDMRNALPPPWARNQIWVLCTVGEESKRWGRLTTPEQNMEIKPFPATPPPPARILIFGDLKFRGRS